MNSLQSVLNSTCKMLKASHEGTIPEDVSAEMKGAQAERDKTLNDLYIEIRQVYNAE